jgi:hypothetical protein
MTEINQGVSCSTGISMEKKKRYLVFGAGIYVFFLFVLAVLGFLTRMEPVIRDKEYHPVQVTICNPTIRNTATWLLKCSIVLPVLLSTLAFIYHRKIMSIVMLLVILLGYPALGISLIAINPMPWQAVDQKIGPDGRTYCFMFYFCDKYLTRLENHTRFSRTFKILTYNPGESNSFIIRPENGPLGEYKLYISKSGLVLGLCYTECYVAYDIHTKRTWGWQSDFSKLSIFSLMEVNTRPYPGDVEKLYEEIKYPSNHCSLPRVESLSAELKNPNPKVREIAKRILDSYKIKAGR